jgi:uncharacterized protein (TIGR02145 family)
MKKITLLSLITIVFIGNLISQAPNLMSYQAVIWDGSGNLVSEKMVSIKISILQGSVTGTSVYSETHRVQTNINGLVSLMIGGGTNATGKIADINWGGGSYFLKTETDPTGGVNFSITGTTQLVSVPYSLASNTSELAKNISTKNIGSPGQTLTIDKDGKMIWIGTNIPTVVTGGVTSITQTDSKVSGIVTSDGGSPIISRGFVWSTNPNPTISLSTKTSDGIGVGTYSSSITGLNPNTKYFIRAYASNSAGTGYGDVVEFITISPTGIGSPCPGIPTVKDIDGNIYNTVQIGSQCWLKENLRVTKFNDGTEIKLDTTGGVTGGVNSTWGNTEKGKRSIYGNDLKNLDKYGYLYNWIAVIKGICPSGWDVPGAGDFYNLRNFLGNSVGGKLKSITGWESPNYGASNESGFTALPGGSRDQNGPFGGINTSALFWTSDESNSPRYVNYAEIYNTSREMALGGLVLVPTGFSVRCIKK